MHFLTLQMNIWIALIFHLAKVRSMPTQRSKEKENVLEDLLVLLVNRWGYPAVLRRLEALKGHDGDSRMRSVDKGSEVKHHRLTARDYVERTDLPIRKKGILLQLAQRFEDREFLPTIGHVKEFLERRNVHLGSVRGRGAAASKVIETLRSLPDEHLEAMLHDESYSGPSRLGPLSDAIKAHGTMIRTGK